MRTWRGVFTKRLNIKYLFHHSKLMQIWKKKIFKDVIPYILVLLFQIWILPGDTSLALWSESRLYETLGLKFHKLRHYSISKKFKRLCTLNFTSFMMSLKILSFRMCWIQQYKKKLHYIKMISWFVYIIAALYFLEKVLPNNL